MKSHAHRLPLIVCLAATCFHSGCEQKAATPVTRPSRQTKPAESVKLAGAKAAPSQVASAAPAKPIAKPLDVEKSIDVEKSLKQLSDVPGEVLAYEQAQLFPPVSGIVHEVKVDLGDQVKKGDLLIQLAAAELEQAVQTRRAQVEVAKAEVAQAEAAVKQAQAAVRVAQTQQKEVEAAIARTAVETDRTRAESAEVSELAAKQVATPEQEEEARSAFKAAETAQREAVTRGDSAGAAVTAAQANLEAAQADLTTAKARVQLAEVEFRGAEAQAARAQIRAPFDGCIATRQADAGHRAHADRAGASPLLSIVRSDVVRIRCDIPEEYVALANAGDEAAVRVPALGSRTWTGKITRTAAALDQQTRKLRLEIDLPNDDAALKPGMNASVSLVLAE